MTKYVLLKRGGGEIELWPLDDVRPDSYSTNAAIPEVKAHEAKQPKQPERPYPPREPRDSEYDVKIGDWVEREIPAKEQEAYDKARAQYELDIAAYNAKYAAYRKRFETWHMRKQRILKRAVKSIDPAIRRYSFAGGNSAGRGLAPRLRFLSAADQRKFDLLDKQIDRLQRRRAALIEASFERGRKPTPEDLWNAVSLELRGRRRRSLRPVHELMLNVRTRITPKQPVAVPEPVQKKVAA